MIRATVRTLICVISIFLIFAAPQWAITALTN